MKKEILDIKYLPAVLMLAILCLTGLGNSQTAMTPADHDTNQRQLANFDNFLDSHPDLASQLRRDPTLVNNQEFVESHAELQEYLRQHPEVRDEIKENPDEYMRRERSYDRREADEDRRRDHDPDQDRTHRELAGMDRFMDSHPEIAEQLRKDPSLVNNREFVDQHPAFKEFLTQHPELREEFKQDPNAFMRQEQRFDRREDDRDTSRWQLANMDRFLDQHPEIAEQLRKDPSLANNKEFVEKHPALQDYLQQHPGVRQEIAENPNAFMRREERFDRHEDKPYRGDADTTRGELASFHEFLQDHGNIAGQLAKDPRLAKNEEYVENHPELHEYLQAHPGVREELSENPQEFMKSAQQFGGNSTMTPKPVAPKSPVLDPKPKQQ